METKLVQCRIGAPDTGNSVGLGTATYSNKFLSGHMVNGYTMDLLQFCSAELRDVGQFWTAG